ncbi:MAG TPA: hypothetical protein PK513_10305 [Alphaproteobacteria bacterium]|nr:hypothetical protein [Alphaproteobacteria bacterium]USO06628.1 MAG: hypothetical protein H6859_05605 [Rhodospirillales bacterium]HOO82879.1 hypothetical protein [Alphaproteobacteria bacterium]
MQEQCADIYEFSGIQIVSSFKELTEYEAWKKTPIAVLHRKLCGDFNGLAQKFAGWLDIRAEERIQLMLSHQALNNNVCDVFDQIHPKLTDDQILAMEQILCDMASTRHFETVLNIEGERYDPVTKNWHHDDGWKQGRILCAYNTIATEGIQNSDAEHQKDEFYKRKGEARIFKINTGDMTRHAVKNTAADSNPFIHRRPKSAEDMGPRLLLQSIAGAGWITLE